MFKILKIKMFLYNIYSTINSKIFFIKVNLFNLVFF